MRVLLSLVAAVSLISSLLPISIALEGQLLRGPTASGAKAPSKSATTAIGKCGRTPENERDARAFFSSKGLLSLEHKDPYYPARSFRWVLLGGREYKGGCAFVIERCHLYDGWTEEGSSSPTPPLISCGSFSSQGVEIIAKSAAGTFSSFEDAFGPLPSSIKVAIGSKDLEMDDKEGGKGKSKLPSDLFYVELKGESAKAAIKTLAAQYATCGFRAVISAKNVTYGSPKEIQRSDGETEMEGEIPSGKNPTILSAEPDGKALFDPTPGRKWKVKDAEFLINRGPSVEIHDVPARFLDEDFLFYYQGSAGRVAPWRACFIREVLEERSGMGQGGNRWRPIDIVTYHQRWSQERKVVNGDR